jgi:hypothetical protein
MHRVGIKTEARLPADPCNNAPAMPVSTVPDDSQRTERPVIVLVPGYMTDADLWREFAPALHGYVPRHAGLKGSSSLP